MQELAMGGGVFDVALNGLEEPTAHGLENIEFLVSAHKGMTPQPLGKVASGGELSRISLAIQTITSQIAQVPTLIFDEVDAGIGGRVAEIVGKLLKDLGTKHQVMCITHLPQVAACGDQQWQVAKSAANGKVASKVTVLDRTQRVEEIARMLGVKITDTYAQACGGGCVGSTRSEAQFRNGGAGGPPAVCLRTASHPQVYSQGYANACCALTEV